ncbi:MAG TPA: HAD family hydrolase [Lachnospiraceae bacterium]|nr:HAD family hydrolase [Lachnospiraceae bacterium]
MYKNYIFDLYGTLLDIHTNESSSFFWDKMAQIYTALGANYSKIELKREYQTLCKLLKERIDAPFGEIEIRDVFKELFLRKGMTPTEEYVSCIANTFRVLSRKYLLVYPGIIDLFDCLKAKGKKIYLLSNAQSIFTIPELKQTCLYDYFDGIVISSEVGICKPNKEFMEYLLDKYSLNVNESIMIGNDKNCDIVIANSCGMDSLYIHSNISPENNIDIKSTYEILNGDFANIKHSILEK